MMGWGMVRARVGARCTGPWNIEVACISKAGHSEGEDAGDNGVECVVSLYCSMDLVPVQRFNGTCMTDFERQKLIATLNQLGDATGFPLNGAKLVELFGVDVFSRLWAYFAGLSKEVYMTALKAFADWQAEPGAELK